MRIFQSPASTRTKSWSSSREGSCCSVVADAGTNQGQLLYVRGEIWLDSHQSYVTTNTSPLCLTRAPLRSCAPLRQWGWLTWLMAVLEHGTPLLCHHISYIEWRGMDRAFYFENITNHSIIFFFPRIISNKVTKMWLWVVLLVFVSDRPGCCQ